VGSPELGARDGGSWWLPITQALCKPTLNRPAPGHGEPDSANAAETGAGVALWKGGRGWRVFTLREKVDNVWSA